MTDARGSSRWPRLIGVAAFTVALFLYRSENRLVFGLWSHAYAGVLLSGLGLLGLAAIGSWHSWRSGRSLSTAARLTDVAILSWGGAYLASALDDPNNGSRVVDVNLFGSTAPVAALGEWLALCLAGATIVVWLARRLGETGRRALLSVTVLALIALLLEGALRMRATLAPETQGFPTYTSKRWKRCYVSLNHEGFRDVDHPIAQQPGQRRLLVVGDSTAFGSGVNDVGDRLGEQLAARLSERLGEPWQSMNAALDDSNTLDEIGYLERMRPYRRDAVLLVYVFNDIDYLAPVTPRSVLSEHPSGILDRLHPARLAFLNFYLFQELYVRVRLASYALSDEPTPYERAYADDAILDRHLHDLERFVDEGSRGGTPVWIVPFDLASVGGGQSSARHDSFVARATTRGLPVLSLAGVFDGEDGGTLRVNRLDGHPNARANRLAAERLAELIVESLATGDGRR